MAKKKKKKAAKQKKAQQHHQKNQGGAGHHVKPHHSSGAAVKLPHLTEPSRTVETTFSKKLEKVVRDFEQKTRAKWAKMPVILLGMPAEHERGPGQKRWRKLHTDLKKISIQGLCIIVLAFGAVGIEALSHNRVFPRISVGRHAFGMIPLDQLGSVWDKRISNYQNEAFVFQYDGQSVSLPLTQLQIVLDKKSTLAHVPVFDFQKNNFLQLVWHGLFAKEVPPVFHRNDRIVFEEVEKALHLDQQRAHSATFILDDQKKLALVGEQNGIIINQAILNQAVEQNLISLSKAPIAITTLTELPAVSSVDLQKFQPDLQVKLENQLLIKYDGQTWKFKPLDYLTELSFRRENDQVIITVPETLFKGSFFSEIFKKIERDVSNLKIFYNEQNQIVFEGQARDGLHVNQPGLRADLEMGINSLDREISLNTEITKAELNIDERLQAEGIKELIGVGHTAFAGSPTNRRHNIANGMSKFVGIIIKPGETFSFNKYLGEVDGSTGYKLELVIKAEGTLPEYGGGICQVSSTFFKAALLSGLPIVERRPHSYAVGYYAQVDGYGLDSTIYPGVVDLKFTNDTPGSILIQPYIDGDHAYVNFFGTNDGRQVKLENYWRGNFRGAGATQLIPTKTLPPGARKSIETAHGGFDASWDRVIIKNGQEIRDKFYSIYRATANRILVGEE